MDTRLLTSLATCALVSCASVDNGMIYGTSSQTNTAELVVEKGGVFGAFLQRDATVAIREVDGQGFKGYQHPLKVDDKIYLSPGTHILGIRIWGSPEGYSPSGIESFTCINLTAESQASYVLRGLIDGNNFRVNFIQKSATQEKILHSFTVPAGGRKDYANCAN